MGDHTLSGQTAGNRQNWRQLILNPFKNDLFEMCGECAQTIFTFKGLDVTGVKNGITGTLRAAAPKLCAPFEIKCKTNWFCPIPEKVSYLCCAWPRYENRNPCWLKKLGPRNFANFPSFWFEYFKRHICISWSLSNKISSVRIVTCLHVSRIYVTPPPPALQDNIV